MSATKASSTWMASTWLFDLGNTRLKCARVGNDGRLGEVHALGHGNDDAIAQLDALLPARSEAAFVASVAAPELTTKLRNALQARFRRVSFARSQRQLGEIRIAYENPAKFGVDRFLALLGARTRNGSLPQLVVGVGTAVTIDLLAADGLHHGGRIAPSPMMMREALHRAAVQLPHAGGTYVEFADDTADALASGCIGAAIALVERSLHQAHEQLGRAPHLLLHGGGAEALLPHLPAAEFSPSLVLEGLATWART